MNIQTPNARNTDPISSHLAGEEITKSGKRKSQTITVSNMVKQREGLTSAELAESFEEDRHMVARRLSDSLYVKKGEPRKCAINGKLAVTWWVA